MQITNPEPLVIHCCNYCCKEERYGSHSWCGWCDVPNCL